MHRIIFSTLILVCLSTYAGAANQVDLTPRGNLIGDTIRAGIEGWFEISIANDAQLGSISLPFILTGSAPYDFIDVAGFLTTPSQPRFVKGIPGSRWMTGDFPDGSCWDLGGTNVTYDPNSSQPDQFLISGVASTAGLAPGPLQPMLEVHYVVDSWGDDYDIRQLCIDSMMYQPAGDFIFVPGGTPEVLWGDSPLCFPVTIHSGPDCPDWYYGNPTTMIVNHCGTGQVRLFAMYPDGAPVYFYLVGVTGGAGTAVVSPSSGDVTYIPDPADVGQVISIEVEAANGFHDPCLDNTWTIDVTVTDNTPNIDCGNGHNIEASGRLFKKFDITSSDPDSCDDIQYGIGNVTPTPVGAYSIDPATGILSFYTDNADAGLDYEFCIDAFDGINAGTGCFIVTVCNCEVPGDVDGSYDVNVGDAVALISYIFKGAVGPTNMNWADVNADCAVNVADAVYLINYIFKGGPEPQVGCYY